MQSAPNITIDNLLDRQLESLLSLQNILAQEKEAIGHDADALFQLSDRKHLLVDELEKLNTSLVATMRQQDGQAGDLNEWLSSQAGRIADTWKRCIDISRECSKMNLVNGTLIEKGQQRVEDIATILSGKEKTVPLYDQSGNKGKTAVSRTLGKV